MIRDPEGFQAFLNETRQWVKEVAIPAEERVEATDEIPEELVEEMRRRGFFGWSIPEQFGGTGLTTEELVLAAMELSQCATAFRARVGTNTGIGSEALVADGTQEQKAKYLPALARGDVTGCFALTEPDAGSDATALRASAVRDGDDYVLNGTKCFITNAPIAGLFTVMARTDADDLSAKGISAFVVEGDTPGLIVGKAYKKMGQAGSPVSEVYFQDCRVPAANLIGGVEGKGFVTAMKVLNKQRLHLSALCTGPAMRMRDEALAHALKRRQFGQPIADFQLVQAMIADIQTEIHAARALILETARKRDQGEDIKLEASMCKYFASEMCGRVADKAVQIFGGAGYVADYSCIERLYRDARLFRLYEGTSQIHQLNIAKLTLRAAS
ncbi:Acyl-CoA dehydrogenase, short-chain specific [Alloalcanivorax dieselolei B5]|uniref:Cyclohexane-1-carbonyl-CoA dehydrogenase n=1 Tax=Alcanivorax dieselolei (strain DSM 16502 / CGMCC 1.3690 / MCCC 1A00001 / B-5) TaxID=930169 RepID=K0C800_ALCDB|nr:acyl-CoA dehydrogenase family protein [Alloalcanivorax dieselolei]AFT68688.1 Acyl-CoA dehydrogenase, short-chain specific [Alloalcanivorax dieselolei B5]GGK05287.1 acyl-CoA dehydrogenase [Alloalcanivorax dieselolei]